MIGRGTAGARRGDRRDRRARWAAGSTRDDEADAFVQRQDGWALTRAGVPAIMVGGSFSNMALLNAFLGGPYHKPDDELGGRLVLDGAAEDANLTGRARPPARRSRRLPAPAPPRLRSRSE